MSDSNIRPEVVERFLDSVVKRDAGRWRRAAADANAAEIAAATSLLTVDIDLAADRFDRILPVYTVAAPYLRAGALSWNEVVDRMDDRDLERSG